MTSRYRVRLTALRAAVIPRAGRSSCVSDEGRDTCRHAAIQGSSSRGSPRSRERAIGQDELPMGRLEAPLFEEFHFMLAVGGHGKTQLAVPSAPAAFRGRVWEVMSRGRGPRVGCPPPEGVDVVYPPSLSAHEEREGESMSAREVYTHGPAFDASLTRRTAAQDGAFFLPHLRAGLRLLDCGCGPGSITLGLAQAVAPGSAVGIDPEERQIVAALALAAQQGVANVTFEVASVYDLPFPEAAFDAVFANNVLWHLRDSLAALREMRRVLRRGGVIGIRDAEVGAEVLTPLTPRLARWQDLWLRVLAHNGGSPLYARHQRRLLLEAGFPRSEAHPSIRGGGTLELTRDHAQHLRSRLEGPNGWDTAIPQGWVTRDEVDELYAELLAWGERPDACFGLPYYAAVGWVDD